MVWVNGNLHGHHVITFYFPLYLHSYYPVDDTTPFKQYIIVFVKIFQEKHAISQKDFF